MNSQRSVNLLKSIFRHLPLAFCIRAFFVLSLGLVDGFVFGFYSASYADLPPIASGGRSDDLPKHIGTGLEIPAVGGVVRPDLIEKSMGFETDD